MTGARPILIVEDDEDQRLILSEHFLTDGEFEPATASTLAEADALLANPEARFDAIVLDLGLPDGDGREWCVRLRRQGYRMPVIILTGACSEDDIVRGLEGGANDYVAKPFRANELLARVRAQIRLFEDTEDATFTIGQYSFRPAAKLLQDKTKPRRIRLTEKETALLKCLLRAGQTVPRPVLLDKVWGYNSGVTTHTLETHIYRLRQKIESDRAETRLLVTEHGGYRLNANTH